MNNPIKFTIIAQCSQTELHRWYGYSSVPPTTRIMHSVSGSVVPRNGERISVTISTGDGQHGQLFGFVQEVSHDFINWSKSEVIVYLKSGSVNVVVSDGWKGPDQK